jgi:23S rRNA (cytosine1962-C5)-methyltransferase
MTTGRGIIVIKRGREKPIIQQHPWIFSGAIERVEGNPTPGDIVAVTDGKGRFLARGYWNPKSQIQVRIMTWEDEPIDEAWWRKMLGRAIEGRRNDENAIKWDNQIAFRLINAENDFLPGLIVDRYNTWLVLQALTLHIDQQKHLITKILLELTDAKGVYERSDVDVRGKEGLNQEKGLLLGEEPPEYILVRILGRKFNIDIREGHKTGFYLDQLQNYAVLDRLTSYWHERIQSSKTLLNLFSYTGGFGLAALDKGAHVTNVDASLRTLELAEENVRLNNADWLERCEFIQADVFDYLRDQAAEGNQWDVVILDPPKFAQNAKQVEGAARGYKDINLNAFKCVKPGGYLMTFSCSGAVSADLFQKIVFGALADSGRQAQILKHLGPGDDHPVALTFPEGAYLKGLLLRVY